MRLERSFGRAVSLQNKGFFKEQFGVPRSGSLSTIVRSFKSAVTNRVHSEMLLAGPVWQPRYYDHVIKDDRDYYFTEQYIELNPLFWDLDPENPRAPKVSIDELERLLEKKYGLNSLAVNAIIEHELERRYKPSP